MMKNKVSLQVTGKDGKGYEFLCDPDSPLGEIHDVLFSMKRHIVEKINEHSQADRKALPDEEEKPEEVEEEKDE